MKIGTNDTKEIALLLSCRLDEIETELDAINNLAEMPAYLFDKIAELEEEQQKIESAQEALHELESALFDIEN